MINFTIDYKNANKDRVYNFDVIIHATKEIVRCDNSIVITKIDFAIVRDLTLSRMIGSAGTESIICKFKCHHIDENSDKDFYYLVKIVRNEEVNQYIEFKIVRNDE